MVVCTFPLPLGSVSCPLNPCLSNKLDLFFYELVDWLVGLKYNWSTTLLVPITQHGDVVFYTFQTYHHTKSSYSTSPHKDITQSLTIMPTLCISYP